MVSTWTSLEVIWLAVMVIYFLTFSSTLLYDRSYDRCDAQLIGIVKIFLIDDGDFDPILIDHWI